MEIISKIITKKNYKVWVDTLNELSKNQNCIFNHPNYLDLYENKFTFSNCFIFREKKNIFIYPYLISKIPKNENYQDIETAYGYGGPISNTNNLLFLNKAFLNLRDKLNKKKVIAELIKFNPYFRNKNIIKNYDGKIIKEKEIIYINLKKFSKNKIYENYKKSCKKKLKKILLRDDVNTKIENTKKSLYVFKKLYDNSMIRLKAKRSYFKDFNFYKKIFNNLKYNFFIFSLEYENEIQTSQLLFFDKNTVYCHMYGSTNKAKENSLILLSYHLLINWAKDKNFKYIDFGGGRTSDPEDSLLNFKKNFSNTSFDLYIGEKILDNKIYNIMTQNKRETVNNRLFKYR